MAARNIKQGQSRYTRFKEERFAPVLSQSIRISKAQSIAKFAYYHIDLNSGSGFNDEAHVQGSPLNFLSAIERNERRDFYAFFVDHNEQCVRDLVQRLENHPYPERIAIFEGDNSEILPVVSEFIARREPNPQYAVGSILIDPNGYHDGVPWEALRIFCREHPRFDLFFNLNLFCYRMEKGQIRIGKGKWAQKICRPIGTFAQFFTRPYWMWTDIASLGGHHWIQLVGRSFDTGQKGYESLGFYDSRSNQAIDILQGIDGDAQACSSQLSLL